MTKAEVSGPGPHDGMQFELPDGVDVVVFISNREPVGLVASCVRRRSANITTDEIVETLTSIVEDLVI